MVRRKMKYIILTLLLVMVFGTSAYASEPNNDLSEVEKNNVINNGDCQKNEDGSYSFVFKSSVRDSRAKILTVDSEQLIYTIIPTTEEAEKNLDNAISLLRAGGSKELTKSDTAGCVSAYSVINWTNTTISGRSYVYLTSVSGGYSAEGSGSYISSGVTVTDHKVSIGQSGFVSGGGYDTQNTTKDIGTSKRSYSYSVNWTPVEDTSGKTLMGTNYVITLKRGTSTWNCEINNNF